MTNELVKRLRGLRVDGTPVDVTMGQAADEIERLRDALKRVRRVAAEGTTHTGMIAALGILVDRSLNPGNGPLPPDHTYHSHEPGEGLRAAEVTNECTHWFSAERGGTFCCYCGASAGDINGNSPSSVRQKLYADVYVTWMKEWAGQVSMADLAAEKAQEALAAFDEATGEKPQGASRGASSATCDCGSAIHKKNCPYVR